MKIPDGIFIWTGTIILQVEKFALTRGHFYLVQKTFFCFFFTYLDFELTEFLIWQIAHKLALEYLFSYDGIYFKIFAFS